MEAHGVNYLMAIGFALIGWGVRVAMYYFNFDKDDKEFVFKEWWMIYDKYIIVGFLGSIVLGGFLGDIVWHNIVDVWFDMDGMPYDERFSIILGFVAIAVLMIFDRKAKDK